MAGLITTIPATPEYGSLAIPKDTPAIRVSDHAAYTSPAATRPAYRLQLGGGQSEGGFGVDLNGDELHFIRGTDVPNDAFTAHADCTVQVQAAHDATKAAAIAAVEAIP